MPIVRGLFVALPVLLLVWVVRMPRSQTTPPQRPAADQSSRWFEDLRIWASLALAIQIAIYLRY